MLSSTIREGSQPSASQPQRVYRIDEYLDSIRRWALKNGFTGHSLAQAAGMSPGGLRLMFEGNWNPKVETLRDLEEFIHRHREEQQRLLQSAHPLDLPEE